MSFAADLQKFADATNAKTSLVVSKVITELSARLISRSPVDTGLFRGSWRYSLSSPDTLVPKTMDKMGFVTLGNISRAIPEQSAGRVHYIFNRQPYGMRLEYGWSKQAPAGMVGITLQEFPQIVDAAVEEVG